MKLLMKSITFILASLRKAPSKKPVKELSIKIIALKESPKLLMSMEAQTLDREVEVECSLCTINTLQAINSTLRSPKIRMSMMPQAHLPETSKI